uniref:Anthranilate synthase component 1 n=1 Tax=Candidatus Kentrum sp. FW TaxID=2126338 RepID=A0A450TUQ8_9GAMM|nr:MAG: anthranilate synthase component 1 [Candidatus Kentron sp. FW]
MEKHFPTTKRPRGVLWQEVDAFPDLLLIHFDQPERYPFLLESTSYNTGHAADRNRYDILFAFPEEVLTLEYPNHRTIDERKIPEPDFLDSLDVWFSEEQNNATTSYSLPPGIPFRGGWFLYLGYELAGQIEPVLYPHLTENIDTSPVEAKFPIAAAWRIPAAIIRDKQKRKTILVTETHRASFLVEMERDLLSAGPGSTLSIPVTMPHTGNDGQFAETGNENRNLQTAALLREPIQEDPFQQFLERIAKITRYIHEGDVFQVNLSRGWRGLLREGITSAHVYDRIRRYNPAPFAGLATWNDFAIISSSPERLIHTHDGIVETRPIAGTHPRDRNPVTDSKLSNALMTHPKERAEHIMLIDLERNDLGRICQHGSVEVNELMVLESYTHVHHIVSNIRGKLTPDATPGKILRAVFPGGTITGCPKVRCMEIIDELEQVRRGPYTGAMGYLNRDGSADLNILIRTICQHDNRISLRAGSGIVADSSPERELRETRDKARGPLRALFGQ